MRTLKNKSIISRHLVHFNYQINFYTCADFSRSRRAFCFGALVACLSGTIMGCSDYAVVKGSNCPQGANLATVLDATLDNGKACQALGKAAGQWGIARLKDGGSIMGPGYKCQVKVFDPASSKLGHALCRRPLVIDVTLPPQGNN